MRSHIDCPSCNSSDAYTEYEDHGYCFSCKYLERYSLGESELVESEVTGEYEYLPWRGITKETMTKFGVQTKIISGKPVSLGFPYGSEAVKVRSLAAKAFIWKGKGSEASLFGIEQFSQGESKYVTITEGEPDAMSVWQMLGSRWPCVSVRSAASAKTDCTRGYDWLNAFERIYLCFDNDGPGKAAAAEVAELFDFNKVYEVKLSKFKDANEYLENDNAEEFKRIWFNSRRFLPEGIVSSQADFDEIIDEDIAKPSASYPFPTLQRLTYGIHQGEFVLITAMEGIGKTEVIRAIEHHLLKSTTSNIGVIHLEEPKARILKGLAGYELNTPVHLPDCSVSKEEVKQAIHGLVGNSERLHIYSHFGSDDPNVLLGTIRFMVSACNCRYVFLDHLTMVVTGLETEDERRTLDFLSTRLAVMVHDLDFTLFCVSHVNDSGQTRGSRNISKVANTWIELSRDTQAEDTETRTKTYLKLFKNRTGCNTGPAGILRFDQGTFKIAEISTELPV